MPKSISLTPEQRSKIFQEGRIAAVLKQSPFVCPYISDKLEERFMAWVDGYRSVTFPEDQ